MDRLEAVFAQLNMTHVAFDAKRPFLLDAEHVQAQIVMQAYVGAATEYLSQLAEPLLLELTETMQMALAADRLMLRAEANLMQAAIGEGMAAHVAARHSFRVDRPTILLPPNRVNGQGEPQAVALLPLALVGLAQDGQAAATIGAIVYLGSVVKDFANGRFAIDRAAVPMRGEAMIAHWLQQVGAGEVGGMLTAVMQKFPAGYRSLPPNFQYEAAEKSFQNNIINLTDLAEAQANE